MAFDPEPSDHQDNQVVASNRELFYQNLVFVYKYLEELGFIFLVKPNIHFFHCKFLSSVFDLGSYFQF